MTVVLGYVPTAPGFAALGVAIQEASLRQASLVVVNVVIGDNFADETVADEKQFDAVRAEVARAGVTHEIRQVTEATEIAPEILTVAQACGAELIVIGLYERSSVGRRLLGSTAQHVLLTATCPVLTIRPGSN
jgi:nucleotide-binding universal stress UspA family protein